MITINEDQECVEISEALHFNGPVQNKYNEILEYQRDDLEINKDELRPDVIAEIKKLLNYSLTHEDKLEILEYIVDEYEQGSEYFESQSIFDDDLIQKGIENWITDNFNIEF